MANENKKWTYAAEALDFVCEKERLGETSDPLYAEALAMVNANQGTREAYEAYRKDKEKQEADNKADRENTEKRLKTEQEAVAQAKAEAEKQAKEEALAASLMTNEEAFRIVLHVLNGGSHPRYEEALVQVQSNHATKQAYQDIVAQKEKQKEQEEAFRLREIEKQEALAAVQKAKEEREKAAAKSEEKQAKDAPAAKTEAVKVDAKTPVESKGVVKGAAEKTEEKQAYCSR